MNFKGVIYKTTFMFFFCNTSIWYLNAHNIQEMTLLESPLEKHLLKVNYNDIDIYCSSLLIVQFSTFFLAGLNYKNSNWVNTTLSSNLGILKNVHCETIILKCASVIPVIYFSKPCFQGILRNFPNVDFFKPTLLNDYFWTLNNNQI